MPAVGGRHGPRRQLRTRAPQLADDDLRTRRRAACGAARSTRPGSQLRQMASARMTTGTTELPAKKALSLRASRWSRRAAGRPAICTAAWRQSSRKAAAAPVPSTATSSDALPQRPGAARDLRLGWAWSWAAGRRAVAGGRQRQELTRSFGAAVLRHPPTAPGRPTTATTNSQLRALGVSSSPPSAARTTQSRHRVQLRNSVGTLMRRSRRRSSKRPPPETRSCTGGPVPRLGLHRSSCSPRPHKQHSHRRSSSPRPCPWSSSGGRRSNSSCTSSGSRAAGRWWPRVSPMRRCLPSSSSWTRRSCR